MLRMTTYLFLPGQPTRRCDHAEAEQFATSGEGTGGFFYDHLRDATQVVRGVRYYLVGRPASGTHALFRYFADDARFVFLPDGWAIDILFDATDAADLREGRLSCDGAQDFLGSWAVRVGGVVGFCIAVGDDA